MRSPRCVSNTATALYRIFVAPIEQPQLHFARRIPSTVSHHASFPALFFQRRSFIVARPAGTDPAKSRLPRDEEIVSLNITLVSPDGKLQEARRTSDVLRSFDRKTHSLVVVVPGENGGDPPICKIIDKKQEWAATKAKKKQRSSSGAQLSKKTIELNWAIEQGDLGHRLVRIKEFLERGHKVEIVLAAKRKGRIASEEEAQALVRKLKEAVVEVGARETKETEGKMLGIMTIFAEGKKK